MCSKPTANCWISGICLSISSVMRCPPRCCGRRLIFRWNQELPWRITAWPEGPARSRSRSEGPESGWCAAGTCDCGGPIGWAITIVHDRSPERNSGHRWEATPSGDGAVKIVPAEMANLTTSTARSNNCNLIGLFSSAFFEKKQAQAYISRALFPFIWWCWWSVLVVITFSCRSISSR